MLCPRPVDFIHSILDIQWGVKYYSSFSSIGMLMTQSGQFVIANDCRYDSEAKISSEENSGEDEGHQPPVKKRKKVSAKPPAKRRKEASNDLSQLVNLV